MKKWILIIVWIMSLPVFGQQANRMELEFKRVTRLYAERDKSAIRELRTYLAEYPYTTFESELHFMMAVLQTERGYYKSAVKEFEKSEYKDLSRKEQTEYQFYRGYAHMMQQDYQKGAVYFGHIKDQESPYKKKAMYYYGYCQYKQDNYDKAMPALKALENEPEYSKTVPYFLVQMQYAKGEDETVRQRAEELIKAQPGNENNGELHRMLGEIYYREKRYDEAVNELHQYDSIFTAKKLQVLRNDLYLLGSAQYQTQQYDAAIETFKRVKDEQDAISEDLHLCLGNAYVQLGDIEKAKLAFLAATRYNIDEKVHYEAMYNYALAMYQSSSSIGESETVFTDFVRQYPNSEHVNDIYMLLSDAFRRAKNYKSALSALDSVRLESLKPTVKSNIVETKQYLRYQIGSDAYVRNRFAEARDWFGAVIKDGTPSSVTTDAYYWRAETEYRLVDYAGVLKDLENYFSRSDAGQSPNRMTAEYLRAYAYFQLKEYDKARAAFERYVADASANLLTYQDALNRLGDCYFYARQFSQAGSFYERAASLNKSGGDYSLFQQGYSLGLQKRFDDKVNVLQQLVKQYPKSDYADDALYEIARVKMAQEKEREAIAAYDHLLKSYPRSDKARSSSIERAMAYRNIHDYDNAIKSYKYTIEHYPASQEAYLAVEGLEAVYVETNRVDEFVAYSKQLPKLNMKVATAEDSLAFVAAELQHHQGKLDAALEHYAPLSERIGSPYAEPSANTAAAIYFERKDYENALTFYRRSLALASERSHSQAAQKGILDCVVALDKPDEIIEIAGQILADEPVKAEVAEEARYQRAKAYFAKADYAKAIPDLSVISKDVRTSIGAESKYLLAQAYFNQKAYDKAEAEVMSFAQQPTQQQYWLARSLIVLAETSHEKGDDFQAKQYLLSLKANYKNQDDILQRVEEKLSAWEEKEEKEDLTVDN